MTEIDFNEIKCTFMSFRKWPYFVLIVQGILVYFEARQVIVCNIKLRI